MVMQEAELTCRPPEGTPSPSVSHVKIIYLHTRSLINMFIAFLETHFSFSMHML